MWDRGSWGRIGNVIVGRGVETEIRRSVDRESEGRKKGRM